MPGSPAKFGKIPFKQINTPDPNMAKVQDEIGYSLSEIDKRFSALLNAVVPIGAILDWHKNLPGCPALPPNFVECNGQKLQDDRSPFNGQTLENLNGGGYFTRGGSKSGVVQAADTVVPAHAHSLNSHTHDLGSHTHNVGTLAISPDPHNHAMTGYSTGTVGAATLRNPGTSISLSTANTATTSLSITGATAAAAGNTGGPSVANTGTDGGSGSETRPKNVSYVKVIRIF